LIMASVMLVLGNLLADILLKLTDPRIELEG
jgi:ABC-type dipeptide/oligopeptide/nickel transport system permease component